MICSPSFTKLPGRRVPVLLRRLYANHGISSEIDHLDRGGDGALTDGTVNVRIDRQTRNNSGRDHQQ